MSRQPASKKPSCYTPPHPPAPSPAGPPITSHHYSPYPSLDASLAQSGLVRYHLTPPSWRPPWTNGAAAAVAAAWPQFYPTVDGMEEDQLTESAVKSGFVGKTVVQTETFSAHQLIYEKLKSTDILGNLARLAASVQARTQENVPTYAPSSFKLPKRNHLHEAKKEAYFADLANPNVPLSKLFTVIPHGYKGEKTLDMLFARKVPFARAVWFVRAFGAAEIQLNLRNRNPLSQATIAHNYTQEWSNNVHEFVRKQLAEISMDSTLLGGGGGAGSQTPVPTPTPNHSRNSTTSGNSGMTTMTMRGGGNNKKAVLADNELRAVWTAKFSYSLRLLEALYEEHLLDRDSFLRFLVNQIDTSNLGQLPFVLFLAEEYLGEFLLTEPLSARLVAACFSRLKEINLLPHPTPFHTPLLSTLTLLIRSTFLALPDAFVSSPLSALESLLLSGLNDEPTLEHTVRADLADLKTRSEAASKGTKLSAGAMEDGIGGEEDDEGVERDGLETIQILDSLTFPHSLSQTHKLLFSHKSRRRRRPLRLELPLLFAWCTSASSRAGPHRRYVVSSLIALEKEELALNGGGVVGGGGGKKSDEVEMSFIEWVDDQNVGGDGGEEEEGERRRLLEELVRTGAVKYSLYLQRMIARGETEERRDGLSPSMHLKLLKSVALYDDTSAGSALAKRRIALRGSSAARAETRRLLLNAKMELFRVVPVLDDQATTTMEGLESLSDNQDCSNLWTALDLLAQDGSHLVVQRQVIPDGVRRLVRTGQGEHLALGVEDHAVLTQTYVQVEDFWGLLQYLLLILQHHPTRDLLVHVLDIIETYLDVWTAMNMLSTLSTSLLVAHDGLKRDGVNERRLIALLRLLGQAGHLEQGGMTRLEQDYQELVLSLSTTRTQTQGRPTSLPEVASLVIDSSPQAIAQLGTTLWYRYHAFDNWGLIAFDSAVQLLSQIPASTMVHFLREINERLPTGLESHIGKWMTNMPLANVVQTFGGALAEGVKNLMAELVNEGILSSSGAVSLVILPAWRALLVEATAPWSAPTNLDPTLLQALETVSSIFSHLVGFTSSSDSPSSSPTVPSDPTSLLQLQRSLSRRSSLYSISSLPDIGIAISLLVIQQEVWNILPDQQERVKTVGMLLTHIGAEPNFQMAVARDPQTLATAMLDSLFVKGIPALGSYRPKLLAALLLTLKDGNTATPANLVSTEDWDLFLSGLTMWRLAVSKVEVQACLERLDLDGSLAETEKAEALHTLSRHFLDRVCSGEGHTYLGEQVVKCYHGRASDELVSVAFTRLAEAVDGLAKTASPERRVASLTSLRCTGRVLNTLLQSGTAASRSEPLNQLLVAIKSCLEGLVEAEMEPSREAVLHATHLVGIALRCTPTPAGAETADLFKDCLIPCAKLAAILAKDRWQESELSAVLLDTCSHLLFGLSDMTPHIRLPPLPVLLSTGDVDLDNLPDSTLSRLTRLFGPSSSTIPLANPWDLVDHSDPGPAQTTRHNAGPIDLAWFDAKIIQAIPKVTALDVQSSTSSSTNNTTTAGGAFDRPERGLQTNFDFETPCIGLSVAARDHRRTLMSSKAVLSKYDPMARKRAAEVAAANAAAAEEEQRNAVVAATAAAQASTSAASTKSNKRKDPPEVVIIDSDDEEPVVVQPKPKKSRTASSGGTTTKGKSKKSKG